MNTDSLWHGIMIHSVIFNK